MRFQLLNHISRSQGINRPGKEFFVLNKTTWCYFIQIQDILCSISPSSILDQFQLFCYIPIQPSLPLKMNFSNYLIELNSESDLFCFCLFFLTGTIKCEGLPLHWNRNICLLFDFPEEYLIKFH